MINKKYGIISVENILQQRDIWKIWKQNSSDYDLEKKKYRYIYVVLSSETKQYPALPASLESTE